MHKDHCLIGCLVLFQCLGLLGPGRESSAASPASLPAANARYGRIAVAKDHAYVTSERLLRIIDVSSPEHPRQVGVYSIGDSGEIENLAVAGNHVYLTGNALGLAVIDVSKPAVPSYRGGSVNVDYSFGLFVSGKYAYVADRIEDNGLVIVDISNPDRPKRTGQHLLFAGPSRLTGSHGVLRHRTQEPRRRDRGNCC
jgi:hypothetical protein